MPLDLNLVVDRIQAQCASFRGVDLASSAATPPAYPWGWVLPVSDDADDNELLGAHTQRGRETIAIDVQIKGAGRSSVGSGVADARTTLVNELIDALAGWQHPDAAIPFNYAGGRLVGYEPGFVTWRAQFRATYYLDLPR